MEEKMEKENPEITVLENISEHIFSFQDEDGNIRIGLESGIDRPEQIAEELENSDFFKEMGEDAEEVNKYYASAIAKMDNQLMEEAESRINEVEAFLGSEEPWEDALAIQDMFLNLERVLTNLIMIVGVFSAVGFQRYAILKDYQRIYRDEVFPKLSKMI